MLNQIASVAGLSILELGAGKGYFMPLLLRQFSGQVPARLVITDHSTTLLNLAQRLFRIPEAEYKLLGVAVRFAGSRTQAGTGPRPRADSRVRRPGGVLKYGQRD